MEEGLSCYRLGSVPNSVPKSGLTSPSISSGARPLDAMRISSASGIRSIFTFTVLSVLYLSCHSSGSAFLSAKIAAVTPTPCDVLRSLVSSAATRAARPLFMASAKVRKRIYPIVYRVLRDAQMPSQCRDRIALSHELDCALTVFRPVQRRSAELVAFRLGLAPERLAVAVSPPALGLPRGLEPLRHPVFERLCCHAVLASLIAPHPIAFQERRRLNDRCTNDFCAVFGAGLSAFSLGERWEKRREGLAARTYPACR